MNVMIAIAFLAGAAAGGMVWFGWAFAQNALAARQAKKTSGQPEKPSEPPAKRERPVRS